MKRLENKAALIIGAAQGLGKAIAEGYAREGAFLAISDVNLEKLKGVEKELTDSGSEVIALELDVANEEQWKSVINKAIEKFGQLHILGSDESSFSTGSELVIDGGYSAI